MAPLPSFPAATCYMAHLPSFPVATCYMAHLPSRYMLHGPPTILPSRYMLHGPPTILPSCYKLHGLPTKSRSLCAAWQAVAVAQRESVMRIAGRLRCSDRSTSFKCLPAGQAGRGDGEGPSSGGQAAGCKAASLPARGARGNGLTLTPPGACLPLTLGPCHSHSSRSLPAPHTRPCHSHSSRSPSAPHTRTMPLSLLQGPACPSH